MNDIFDVNKIINDRLSVFWPQKNFSFFHEDNFKTALSIFFYQKNILFYPEFSISNGRIDLLGVDIKNKEIYVCEFKHCYVDVLDKILNDFNRLEHFLIEDEIKNRTGMIVNKKNQIFIGGGMSDIKLLFESAADSSKISGAIDYLKKCNVQNYQQTLNNLHKYLSNYSFKIFYNKSGVNEYWVVICIGANNK